MKILIYEYGPVVYKQFMDIQNERKSMGKCICCPGAVHQYVVIMQ